MPNPAKNFPTLEGEIGELAQALHCLHQHATHTRFRRNRERPHTHSRTSASEYRRSEKISARPPTRRTCRRFQTVRTASRLNNNDIGPHFRASSTLDGIEAHALSQPGCPSKWRADHAALSWSSDRVPAYSWVSGVATTHGRIPGRTTLNIRDRQKLNPFAHAACRRLAAAGKDRTKYPRGAAPKSDLDNHGFLARCRLIWGGAPEDGEY